MDEKVKRRLDAQVEQLRGLTSQHASQHRNQKWRKLGLEGRPLRLLEKPVRSILPTKDRDFSQIEPGLAQCLLDFASGQHAWPLLLHGGVGSGKTCAALALSDLCASVEFETIGTICDRVMRRDDHVWESLRETEVLIVDELGQRNNVTDLEHTTLARLLDEREGYNDSVGVYLTNHDPEGLRQLYDDRIVSRLLAGTSYHAIGRDRRVG